MEPRTDSDARAVYNYHRMALPLPDTADAIFCLCSLDTRVARRAAELFLLSGHSSHDRFKHLIFSGGSGKLTESRFDKPEAEVFAAIAHSMGVPDDKIIVEPHSTNTGENVRFTWSLLQERGIQLRSLVLVQKPYMERRTYATFKKQWPDAAAEISVTSPQLEWDEYPDAENPRDLVISIAVGDLMRIREYPARGFQIAQDVPEKVWEAGQRLVAAGYNTHLP
ncbi:YdcF family protein [Microdochium nivale]|nr:YdcF family protein [Microdochium nivale]